MEKEYKNQYNNAGYFFIILIVFVFIGFYKTYFGMFPRFKASITNANVVHFHAAVLSIWLILLVVQPMLIRYRKMRVHRLLGKFSYFLVPLIIGSFIALVYTHYVETHMQKMPLSDVLENFYFQIIHTILFSVFYILALVNKRNTALHAGYMIATGLIFINPSLKRVFLNGFNCSFTVSETIALLFTDVVIIALLLFAKRKNINYKLYYIILCMFLVYQIPMFLIMYYFYPGM
jgi:hypothetical protein